MFERYYSFRFIIIVSLLWLMALAYGLSYYSTDIYHDLAVESQKTAIEELVRLKSIDLLKELQETQKVLGYRLRQENVFKDNFYKKNKAGLSAWLAQSYNRYFITTGLLTVESLLVKDADLQLVAFANKANNNQPYDGCSVIDNAITASASAEKLKSKSALCLYQGLLYSEVAVPIGSFSANGYLYIIVEVANGLKKLEADLNMPIRFLLPDGSEGYRSTTWLDTKNEESTISSYTVESFDGLPGLQVAVQFDLSVLDKKIEEIQTRFLLITSLVTWLTFLLVMFLLNKAYLPLDRLKNSAGLLLRGEYKIIADNSLPNELKAPVQAFNKMLIGLRAESEKRSQVESHLKKERDFISATLDSISNAVIVIGLDKRIQFVNPAAEKILSIDEGDLVGYPFEQVVVCYARRDMGEVVDIQRMFELCQQPEACDKTIFVYDSEQQVIELEFSSTLMRGDNKALGYLLILKDVTEDRKLRRQLSFNAYHDRLTGLLNRRAFEESFEKLIVENPSEQQEHIIAYMDLDQFKVVNDTCGHAAGDLLLKQLTVILKPMVRKSDVIARLGGDEFGLILPFCSLEKAQKVMQSIIREVVEYRFVWDEKVFSIGVSIGVAQFGSEADTLAAQMSAVDTACYLAKQAGGNQVHFYKKDDAEVLAHQGAMDWVAGINKGLSENRFVLYIQPIQCVNSKDKTKHYEVLIRYLDDSGMVIPPGAFLPAAERYNLIERIDLFVVRSIIEWLTENSKAYPNIMFSINLSGRSLGSNEFQTFIEQLIKDSEIDTSALCFEITETAIVSDVLRSIEFIKSLKALGAKFSLDDFGSGLSSFAYLKQFPVDYLKIDGMFVKDIMTTPEDYVFVRSMAEVGHCLGMKVIAEFVESKKMYHLLREAKVDYVQGWAVGKPEPLSTLLEVSSD